MTKLSSTIYRIEAQNGSGIIHKADDGRWSAKVYSRGELHTDLGTFKTRREAADTASYHLDYEVR